MLVPPRRIFDVGRRRSGTPKEPRPVRRSPEGEIESEIPTYTNRGATGLRMAGIHLANPGSARIAGRKTVWRRSW